MRRHLLGVCFTAKPLEMPGERRFQSGRLVGKAEGEDYCIRLRSCIQLVSHVLPPSGEYACSQ